MYTFIHVNKCGGKSIDECLSKFCKDNKLEYQEIHGLVGRPVTKRTKGSLILFVRDPIERFISSYWYYRRNHYLCDLNELIEKMRKGYKEEMFKKNLHFFYSLSSYIHDPGQLTFYFIGYQETLERDFKRLIDKISEDNKIESPEYKLYRLNKTKRLNKELSKENIKYLRELYKRDYEILEKLDVDSEWLKRVNERTDYKY